MMFEARPKARAVLKAGTLYAVSGEGDWIYFGQVAPDKKIGFFRKRARKLIDPADILAEPVMSVVNVVYPSITRALRSGLWIKLGHFDLVGELVEPRPCVGWPAGTLTVEVYKNGEGYETRVENPDIQQMERAAAWDAIDHIPERLTADFGEEEAKWHVGGPIWRERRVAEERARRFPDAPWHQLPSEWVPTSD